MARGLIVDDDEADRLLMRAMVTDIQMPRGDGIELISALKGIDPDAAIIAVSGHEPHKLQVGQLAGARSTLAKPLAEGKLAEAVREAARPETTELT